MTDLVGAYYTPRGLVPEVIYPACGSGAFLARVVENLRREHPEVELIILDPPFKIWDSPGAAPALDERGKP